MASNSIQSNQSMIQDDVRENEIMTFRWDDLQAAEAR